MATIKDVAKRAGVSPVTVSRVINDSGNVSAATRERVQRAIEELGYVPSVAARSLRSKRTRTLALVVPDITNTFWTTVARGVEDTAQSRDYSVFVYNTDENPAKQLRYLAVLVSQRVDGVIIAPYESDARHLAKLRHRNTPTVVIDRRIEGWDVDSVRGDSVSGARALVQHLISLGHRRIAMLSGPLNTSTAEDRVTGYRIALTEAGLPLDPRLIKRGEFRTVSGEELTHQVFEEGLNPTAIFAANNAIALGVIDAVAKRGLRIPQDVALVCFDDLPNASHLFPFLTVAVQPAYDMGVNAAQLLLSRLDSEGNLQPRHVVLPTRLVLRYSCGRNLQDDDQSLFSLPLLKNRLAEEPIMVKPIGPPERRDLPRRPAMVPGIDPAGTEPLLDYHRSDLNRLLKALHHQEPDRVPHLEFWVTSKSVYEYVLERKLEYDLVGPRGCGPSITPEDHVEFALRLGMDAVMCSFAWRPNSVLESAADGTQRNVDGSVTTRADLDDLEPPPSRADQLSHLERYLRAAQATGVGVIANFTSFFDSAVLAVGLANALYMLYHNRPLFNKLMDILVEHQAKVVQAVCDRFADDLAFVMVTDDIAHNAGLLIHPEVFMEIFPHRMQRLIAPAQEHGKLLLMHSRGRLADVLPILHEVGFNAIHPIEPECNDILALKRQWAGRLALVGNIPTALLMYGTEKRIEATVQEYCLKLAPGGGYVLSTSGGVPEGVPPANFVALARAVHRYGRYGTLGQEA